jgi:hypothetical protein
MIRGLRDRTMIVPPRTNHNWVISELASISALLVDDTNPAPLPTLIERFCDIQRSLTSLRPPTLSISPPTATLSSPTFSEQAEAELARIRAAREEAESASALIRSSASDIRESGDAALARLLSEATVCLDRLRAGETELARARESDSAIAARAHEQSERLLSQLRGSVAQERALAALAASETSALRASLERVCAAEGDRLRSASATAESIVASLTVASVRYDTASRAAEAVVDRCAATDALLCSIAARADVAAEIDALAARARADAAEIAAVAAAQRALVQAEGEAAERSRQFREDEVARIRNEGRAAAEAVRREVEKAARERESGGGRGGGCGGAGGRK